MRVVSNASAHKGAKHVFLGVEGVTPEVAICRCSCGELVLIPTSELSRLQLSDWQQGEWWVSGANRISVGKTYNGWFVNRVCRDFVGNVYYECMRKSEDSAGAILLTRETLRSFANSVVRQSECNGNVYVPGKTSKLVDFLQVLEEVGSDYFSIFQI